MQIARDPRDTITPDAFSVAPELLGLPLARPWRRLAAILIDLALIGLLANVRGVFFALAAGSFLFWLAVRGPKRSTASRTVRATLGCFGAVVLFTTAVVIWFSRLADENTVLFTAESPEGGSVPVTVGAIADFASLLGSEDTLQLEEAAQRMVQRLSDQGISAVQMRSVLAEVTDEGDARFRRVVERAISAADTVSAPAPISLDSLLAAYTAARAAGDSTAEAHLRPRLGAELGAEQLARREQEIVRLTARNEQLTADLDGMARDLEEARSRGIMASILGFLDELGLGIGWSGLYFTFMTAFFRGRTPGKRALGIRVLRLDGKPVTYWVAFERFGGYAASLFTGLEGFARILWDRNRQGLEDKLAETVVIRETKEARAQLAAATAARSVSARPWEGPVGG